MDVVDQAEMIRIASTYWPVWSPGGAANATADAAVNAAANAAAKAAAKAAANAAAAILPASQRHWLKKTGGPMVPKVVLLVADGLASTSTKWY